MFDFRRDKEDDDHYDDDFVNDDYRDEDYHGDDEDDRDYFTGPDLPDPPKKPRKAPVLKPEDPAFWDQEESEWEHLKPRKRIATWMWVASSFIIILLSIAVYLRFFSPYREAATQYGYVESIETRGTVIKTIEGVLLPYKNLMDTTRVYNRDFIFTVKDKKVAADIYAAMTKNQPIRVTYKEYSATVPWRGESRIIVTSAVPVDPKVILPPDRQPQGL